MRLLSGCHLRLTQIDKKIGNFLTRWPFCYNIEIFQKATPIFRRGKFKFSKIKPINVAKQYSSWTLGEEKYPHIHQEQQRQQRIKTTPSGVNDEQTTNKTSTPSISTTHNLRRPVRLTHPVKLYQLKRMVM